MKTAFSIWEDRIAPVFDTADQMLVVELEDARLVSQTRETLPAGDPLRKVARIVEMGIGTLVCGAVSRELQGRLAAGGIRFIPFVAGELQAVVAAWRGGRLPSPAFTMPGCGCGRRARCGRGGGRMRAGCGGGPRPCAGNRVVDVERKGGRNA